MGVGVRDVPGGHEVVVAIGFGGVAMRDADGTWQNLGWAAREEGDVA